tara:strand:- start:482 stop:592 length:111 start_codon:yes stop_codon:yes gene_type:complete
LACADRAQAALLTRLLTEAGSAEMTISTVDAFQVDA